MRKTSIVAVILLFITTIQVKSQDFIRIESPKMLCLFNFLETASGQRATSYSYQEFIRDSINSKELQDIAQQYAQLKLEYSTKLDEYPSARHQYLNSKDLLWVASSETNNISEFSSRITGILPHQTHSQLIAIMKRAEPIYDKHVWIPEQANMARIQSQIEPYIPEIKRCFLSISKFYGADWDESIPFNVALYPIPIRNGMTTAIPKGNALICAFLAHNEHDYKGVLGVIIHEMCHILYEAQTPEKQHAIDQMMNEFDSPYSKYAYTYLNEGLATALGNGWAYQSIHGKLDTMEWYNDPYINGFAKALYPMTKQYVDAGQEIDSSYLHNSINLFSETFPKAIYQPRIVFNQLTVFLSSEEMDKIDAVANATGYHLRTSSMHLSAPIDDPRSTEMMELKSQNKLFVVINDHDQNMKQVNQFYTDHDIDINARGIYSFIDASTGSTVAIICTENSEDAIKGIQQMSELEQLPIQQWIDIP